MHSHRAASPVAELLLVSLALLLTAPADADAAPLKAPVVSAAEQATAANRAVIEVHVHEIAQRVLGAGTQPVALIEKASVIARPADGEFEISTGLLGLLTSDAQFAMLLSYEHARAQPRGAPSDTTKPRRKGRAAIRADDAAVVAALSAVSKAGFDAAHASSAWSRLEPARSLGLPEPGGLGDLKADRQRLETANKWLASAGAKANPKGRIGEDEYQRQVRARLAAWKILDRQVGVVGVVLYNAATPGDSTTPSTEAANTAWLTYERSGGITGWRLVMTLQADGRVHASESRRGGEPVDRTLSADEMSRMRALLAQALAAPARQADTALGSLRDGQMRSVEIREGERSRRLTLSDGYSLFPFDGELIQLLEGFAR